MVILITPLNKLTHVVFIRRIKTKLWAPIQSYIYADSKFALLSLMEYISLVNGVSISLTLIPKAFVSI